MLRLEGILLRKGRFILEIDQLHIREGELCLIVGPSGAGKSLLLRVVAGLVRPESGSIALRGVDSGALPPEARRVGLVFQHYSLFPHLSVLENVAFGLKMRGTPGDDARLGAESMLERLGCTHLADRRPVTLSGGEQQRVAIARALVTGADLLLLDEPFAALDPATRAGCRLELAELRRSLGFTVLEVTHALDEAGAHADRILVLDDGRIVADDPYVELVERPPNLRAARALGLENLLPWDLTGGEAGPVCHVPPSSVTITAPNDPMSPGDLGIPGIVETVEKLGPAFRVRLLVDHHGEPVRLTGFAKSGEQAPSPGSVAMARFHPDSVRPLPD
ncbi:MAG: ABC transporter ATP-binding protein [Methanospirillum sp.]|nr:ABC transporter ATP-binding protein [Methanospirillum sp.]